MPLMTLAVLGMLAIGVVVLVCSRKAREQLKDAFAALKGDQITGRERIMILAGVSLIVSGAVIPGPLDELVGFALIGRGLRRISARS